VPRDCTFTPLLPCRRHGPPLPSALHVTYGAHADAMSPSLPAPPTGCHPRESGGPSFVLKHGIVEGFAEGASFVLLTPPGALCAPPSPSRGGRRGTPSLCGG